MSRIGKQPISIPAKVKVEIKGQQVFVEGPKGKLNWELPQRTSLKVDKDKVMVSRNGDDAPERSTEQTRRRPRPCPDRQPALAFAPARALRCRD